MKAIRSCVSQLAQENQWLSLWADDQINQISINQYLQAKKVTSLIKIYI